MHRPGMWARGWLVVAALAICVETRATEPPRRGDLPDIVARRLREFDTERGLTKIAEIVRANRTAQKSNTPLSAVGIQVGDKVQGVRAIPVLMGRFANSPDDAYPVADLQKQLFDGPWPSGTMTEYYKEVSYGAFTVTGAVHDWRTLPSVDIEYEGPDTVENGQVSPCYGMCAEAGMLQFIQDMVTRNDAAVDFTQYDNDGPDGRPNSGDDDGFVDFIALVHPERGGECNEPGNRNIWSHRHSYSLWAGSGRTYETNDIGKNGARIRIDDYVVIPAKSCGGDMIEIGVFAHEFGHAFGLPDLYDTVPGDGRSAGIGEWGLMGLGSWGGDGASPSRPSHMSAWEKEFLGWIDPTEVKTNKAGLVLKPVETTAQVFKISISDDEEYLIEHRGKIGFDDRLPGAGLLIWRINKTVVTSGLRNNRVNGDELNQGVELVEADGLEELDMRELADFGDMFPGAANRSGHDRSTEPPSAGSVAICKIAQAGQNMRMDVKVTTDKC